MTGWAALLRGHNVRIAAREPEIALPQSKRGRLDQFSQLFRSAGGIGVRVSEIAEASTKDISQIGGIWCIKILLDDREETAELKSEDSWRVVPLHSAVIREGFLSYVEEIRRKHGDGPLFPMITPNKDGRRGTPASNKVSKWLRNKLKISDLKIAPNLHQQCR
jgi:hypothetical protein